MKLTQKQYDIIVAVMETIFADGMRKGATYATGVIDEIPEFRWSPPLKIFDSLVEIEEETDDKNFD